jgi:hypothetical protein
MSVTAITIRLEISQKSCCIDSYPSPHIGRGEDGGTEQSGRHRATSDGAWSCLRGECVRKVYVFRHVRLSGSARIMVVLNRLINIILILTYYYCSTIH